MDSIKEYWRTWLWRDAVTKIITINFLIWLLLAILWLIPGADSLHAEVMLSLPGAFRALPMRVWTLLTYMFTQSDFMHLLCNMLWFMLFGNLLMQMQGGVRVVAIYLYGGIAAALVFMAVSGSPVAIMMGASCAVLAIIGAVMLLVPEWRVNLLIFGPVKVLWISVAAIVFFVVLTPSYVSSVAHAAGLLVGVAYALLKKQGIDITTPVTIIADRISGIKAPTAKPVGQIGRNGLTPDEEREFDALLAKTHRSGYASLSAHERQRMFNLSQKIRR